MSHLVAATTAVIARAGVARAPSTTHPRDSKLSAPIADTAPVTATEHPDNDMAGRWLSDTTQAILKR